MDPVKDVVEGWKDKDYPRVAKGLAVGFAVGFVVNIVLRILAVVIPLVAIFVFDGNPLLWGLVGLVFFFEPLILLDLIDLITSPFQRGTPPEKRTPLERRIWTFDKWAAIAGLVAIAFLAIRG